jgi:ATP-dependent RNA helicase RhlE
MNFTELGLNEELLKRCEEVGYSEPTPIQQKAIPLALSGTDLIGCAETGSGKTAAFLFPSLQRLMNKKGVGVRLLVLAPTRELVSQIDESFRSLSPKQFKCASIIGGANINRQIDALKKGVNAVVATPGRLNDHIERGTVDISKVEILVLDEADRMLDMGFLPQIKRIISATPSKRQTLLFSATMSTPVQNLAWKFMREPEMIEASPVNKTAHTIDEVIYPVATNSKLAMLIHLLEKNDFDKALVFTRTKRSAEKIAHILKARDHHADEIHADRSQAQRERALRDFKSGKTKVLIATDIASRGIDVELVSHVINFDVPESPEDYVHRVGRTGRAGNYGEAITLASPIDEVAIRAIQKLTGKKIKRVLIPEFGGVDSSAKPKSKLRK